MNTPGAQEKIIESIRSSETILVTVSKNPSVDELAAALGLTMQLNDMGKHATAVVSGEIPPAITFLKPEKTFNNSVDSLRDFVIALDKEKADHLRYKVEGDMVKIFITPYKTVITEKDFEYSQGDYNVQAVIALGVVNQEDLDKALESHGKILHDAVVATIGLSGSSLGSIDWHGDGASSISEIVSELIEGLKGDDSVDERVASALLTGIVAATDRFSNDKTSPMAMNAAAKLMSYGANQQLIAARLSENPINLKPNVNENTKPIGKSEDKNSSEPKPENNTKDSQKENDNNLTVQHEDKKLVLPKPLEKVDRPVTPPTPITPPVTKPIETSKEAVALPQVTPVDNNSSLDNLSFEPTPISPVNDLANELAKEAGAEVKTEPDNMLEKLLDETKQVAKQSAENRLESSKIKLPLTPHADQKDQTLEQIDEKFRKPAQPSFPVAPPVPFAQNPEPGTPTQTNINQLNSSPEIPAPPTLPVPIPGLEMPPLPPMPDFSQNPPLPPAPDFSQFLGGTPNAAGSPTGNNGVTPAPTTPQAQPTIPQPQPKPTSTDPGQFRIPGQ